MPKPPPITRHTVTAPSNAPGTRLQEAWDVALDKIEPNPWQPRQHADAERMRELTEDIRKNGILQPLVVRLIGDDKYQVVAGERRYRAARALDLPTVPVIVKEMSEAEARTTAIRENVHREDMDPEDEGRYYQSLQDAGTSLREIAEAIGKSHQYVYRRIALVEKPGALAAYRAGQANLVELAGAWEPEAPVPLDEAHTAGMTPAEDRAEAPVEGSQTSNDTAALPGRPPQERSREAAAARPFQRRPAIYRPFQSLALHVSRLAPAALPVEDRQELRATIRTLREQLTDLEARLAAAGDGSNGVGSDGQGNS